jgi:hypothetical protein
MGSTRGRRQELFFRIEPTAVANVEDSFRPVVIALHTMIRLSIPFFGRTGVPAGGPMGNAPRIAICCGPAYGRFRGDSRFVESLTRTKFHTMAVSYRSNPNIWLRRAYAVRKIHCCFSQPDAVCNYL